MKAISREEVYEAIDFERECQDRIWGADQKQSFAGLLLAIEAELQEVKDGWLKNASGKSAPLNELVQVAATCVAALEKYGVSGNPVSTDDQLSTGYRLIEYKRRRLHNDSRFDSNKI